jgi:hypothetical protein
MKISRERWDQAQIAEYSELNENTDPGENAYAYAVKATFDLLNLNPEVDLKNKVVVEVGTGFYPALLWAEGLKRKVAVDPLFNNWPEQYKKRCIDAGIEINTDPYEESKIGKVDETWFFNVLQHVIDPEAQLKKAMKTSKVVRVFEPIGWGNGTLLTTNEAHPHIISKETITNVMGDFGFIYQPCQVERFHQSECYYGTWVK